MRRIWPTITIALLLSVILAQSWAAESKKWVTLTNCHYVDRKDNDGDSFCVKCGTDEFIVRLYFVDAPEANLRYPERTREQSEYFGITIDETMKAGRKARDMVRELLREPFVIRTRRASAAGRSIEPRYYAFIEVGGKSLAEVLVSQGLARPKGVTVNLPTGENWKAYLGKLRGLESEARQKRLGIWGGATEKKPETKTR